MVETKVVYEGGLRCAVTHGPSGNQITTDAPVDNHGKGEAFSPTDLVAAATGACMVTILGIVAEREQVDVTGTTVVVQKEMSADTPRRISRLVIQISVPLSTDHCPRRKLEAAAMACPVKQSLHPDIAIEIDWSWR